MNPFEKIKPNACVKSTSAHALVPSTPMAVVRDMTMTIEEKRSLLASWASDARQVLDHPALRRLDDGSCIEIDDILEALQQLSESFSEVELT